MQISYDKEADSVAIWFQGVESYRTIDISEDIFIDVDKNERLAGVEILHASEKFNVMDLLNISIQLPNQEKLTIQLPNFIGMQLLI